MNKSIKFAAAWAAVVCALGAVAQPLDQCKVTAEAGAGGTVYVDAANGNDETGNGLAANPYATLQKALAVAADGSTIFLQDGTYLMDDPYTTIARPITIKSVNGPANCSLTKAATAANSNKRGILKLNHDDVVLDGLTLCNGYVYNNVDPGSPVVLTKGVVQNCIIRDNQGGSDGNGNHGGVTVNGGTLRDCVIRGNWATYNNPGLGVGGGVYLSAGLVENCVITNNGAGSKGGGVYMTGADSVLRNCLVGFNHGIVGFNHGLPMSSPTTKNKNGGGIYVEGGTVDRCTVRGNYSSDGAGVYLTGGKILNSLVLKNHGSSAGGGIRNEGGTVVNCTVADNEANGTTSGTGFYQSKGVTQNTVIYGNPCGIDGDATVAGGTFDHNFTMVAIAGFGDNAHGNVFYKDAANEDYTLLAGSKAIDGGVAYEGVETDLAGTVRPQGAAPDMGCYEYLSGQGPLSCSFNAPDVTLFLEEGEATFVASADGADTEGLAYAWYFNGVLQEGETGSTIAWASIPRGAHTVKLVVSNGAGATAECELKDVIKVTTTHVYANETGSNTYPYDTPEKGANKLQDALDAVWCTAEQPGLVTVQPGSYSPYSKWFVLNKPIRLVAAEGPSVTTIAANDPNGPSYDGKRVCRGLFVTHEQAWIEGFTVRDGWWYSAAGDSGPGGMRMSAGVVTNCVFTNNRGGDNGGAVQMSGGLLIDCRLYGNWARYNNDGCNTRGGGIYMTGGEVALCVVSNNWAAIRETNDGTGGGVWMSGGTLRDSLLADNYSKAIGVRGVGLAISGGVAERCVISGNSMRSTVVNDAAGAWISGGTIRNCLIAGNKANNNGAGVYQTGGTMEFCTVTANTSANKKNSGLCLDGANAVNRFNIIYGNGEGVEAEPESNLHFAKAQTFTRNIVQPATDGTDNIASDPGFTDAAAGDYTLGAGSPAIDKAIEFEADYLTVDLAGNVRPKDGNGDGDAVCDLGCYEAPDASEGPLSCSFSPLESSGLDEVTVTFEASVSGSGSKGELHYNWDFGEGVLVDGSADVPNPTVKFSTYGSHTVSLTVTAEGGKTATKTALNCVKVGSTTIYVNEANESPRWPYNTWETAATDLTEAFNSIILASGSVPTFVLTNGTYRVEQKAFILSFPVRFTSVEGPEKTIVQAANPDSNNKAVFWVENAGAQVDGLAMTGAYWDGLDGGGASALRLTAGVVSNCVIRNSSAGRSSYGAVSVSGTGLLTHSVIHSCSCDSSFSAGASQHGGGLAIWGDGVVAHTVVSNCYSTSISQDCAGGGVYQYGGTLRDSQVLDCYISGKDYQGAAIWQSGGLCERCVFGDTKHKDSYGAAVYLTGGTNRNNLVRGAWTSKGAAQALTMTGGWFWNNTVVTNGWGSTQASPVAAVVTDGEVKNCLFALNAGTDVSDSSGKVWYSRFAEATGARYNLAADPKLRSPKRDDWRVRSTSPCVNAGDASVWEGVENPIDLRGDPRVLNRQVDIGCYEVPQAGLRLIVR